MPHPQGRITHLEDPVAHPQGPIAHPQGPITHNQIMGEGTDWSHDHPFGIEILLVSRGLIVRDLDQGPHIQELIIDRQG